MSPGPPLLSDMLENETDRRSVLKKGVLGFRHSVFLPRANGKAEMVPSCQAPIPPAPR